MSKVIDILNSNRQFASFELVPPLKGSDAEKLAKSIEPLMEFAPPFINVTCHRDEIAYHENPDGTFTKTTFAKRPSTIAIVAGIMQRFKVNIVPHVICGGATKSKLESDLFDFNFLGIDNVVALRGDALPGYRRFIPETEGFAHANELVELIANMNHGQYLDPDVKDGVHTDFCIGVGAYPEKHYEAANMGTDIQHLKDKVDAGADYILTQMFFDNTKFYDFVDKCRAAGITVPIVPGLKPISTIKQIDSLPQAFHLDIPEELVKAFRDTKDKDAAYQVGVEWCIAQSKDLLAHDVPAIHYYTMGRAKNIQQIVRTVF
ncbi:MAG: methylenetetrahydrofolate reductase [NAD(P)H] [Prevotella sp.]